MLRVEALSVRFRRHDGLCDDVLDGVDLTLPRGALRGLVGGSGAGKSLVAEALLGLLPRNALVSGQMRVDGRALRTGDIGLAPQGVDALDPLMRVGAQMDRMARLAGAAPQAVTLARAVGLPEATLDAWPHELSGGMAKRALIATALATGAPYLVADEPTLGLDPATADKVLDLLAAIARGGVGVLVISHDLPRLVARAEQVTILHHGQMVETAPAAAFGAGGLQHPFSRRLWAAQHWGQAC
ncbi:MAG: ATP-binding cassette domain-containing protein [Roseinatronobacter sp.]